MLYELWPGKEDLVWPLRKSWPVDWLTYGKLWNSEKDIKGGNQKWKGRENLLIGMEI